MRRLIRMVFLTLVFLCLWFPSVTSCGAAPEGASPVRRLLYVAAPGIRDQLQYGGHGLLVFDMDHAHRFVKRIPTTGTDANGKPLNVKGVCASTVLDRIYVSTIRTLMCIDLRSEKLLWERAYEGGCDRMSMTPDSRQIFLPSLEGDHWHVVDPTTGDVLAKIVPQSGAHNTICGLDGKHAYLAGLKSPQLAVVDTATHEIVRQVGPFSAPIRPFTVNGAQTRCFVNVNGLLGFEIGDLTTGRKLHRVEVPGFKMGAVQRHGCPSHGIGMTPDEREIWVTDAFNQRLHVFDARTMPPRYLESIALRAEPGWVTFSLDGQYAYPSTGDVIDTHSRKIVAHLTDENGNAVESEKLLELDFQGDDLVATGDQFGLGRVTKPE